MNQKAPTATHSQKENGNAATEISVDLEGVPEISSFSLSTPLQKKLSLPNEEKEEKKNTRGTDEKREGLAGDSSTSSSAEKSEIVTSISAKKRRGKGGKALLAMSKKPRL